MSIAHVVAFQFRPDASPGLRDELSSRLDALARLTPGVESYRHGTDLGVREGNLDYAVSAVFVDLDAFAAYSRSPMHLGIIDELIAPNILAKSAVQFTT